MKVHGLLHFNQNEELASAVVFHAKIKSIDLIKFTKVFKLNSPLGKHYHKLSRITASTSVWSVNFFFADALASDSLALAAI